MNGVVAQVCVEDGNGIMSGVFRCKGRVLENKDYISTDYYDASIRLA